MARTANTSRQTRKLLAALAVQPRTWRHGYQLSKETGLTSGTLYPALMRLCDQGFLESKWGESEATGRPPRHLYRLTSRGAALAQQADADLSPATLATLPRGFKA